MDRHFGPAHYSVEHLFRDEQREILRSNPGQSARRDLQHPAAYHRPLRAAAALHGRFASRRRSRPWAWPPKSCSTPNCAGSSKATTLDVERVRSLLAECAASKVDSLQRTTSPMPSRPISTGSATVLSRRSETWNACNILSTPLIWRASVPFQINLWKPQNTYYDMIDDRPAGNAPLRRQRATSRPRRGSKNFSCSGEKLGFASVANPNELPP